jgi:putative transposase
VIGLPRSTYYYRTRDRQAKLAEDASLIGRLSALSERFPRYGYRRMTAQLRAEGAVINRKKVARLMRQARLTVISGRRFKSPPSDRHDLPVFPNLARGMRPSRANELWVADLTYVHVRAGFVYLAVILDAWSRRVVGFALSAHIDSRLTLAALDAAVAARGPVRGCVHHSDRGVQYASEDYRAALVRHGLIGSMSRTGNPYDNAKCESFIKTLKVEEVYLNEYEDLADVARNVTRFIDEVYNSERLHSALGYRSPIDYELRQAA